MKKIVAVAMLTLGLLSSPAFVYADTVDEQIAIQKDKLARVASREIEQSQSLSKTMTEITGVESQIASAKTKLQQAQTDIDTLSKEVSNLEDIITKRSSVIAKQARHMQTTQTAEEVLDVILSSDSFMEALNTIIAMSTLTNASHDQLEKQRHDKLTLEQKHQVLETNALRYADQSADLELLRNDLLSKTTQAQVELADLQLAKATTESDIKALQEQKQEAEKQREAAQKIVDERQKKIDAQKQTIAASLTAITVAQPTSTSETTQQITQTLQSEVASTTIQAPITQTSEQTTVTQATTTPEVMTTQTTSTTQEIITTQSTTQQTVASVTSYISPITNPSVTSPYGVSRSFQLANGQWYSDVHNGIDLVNGNSASPIVSVANGTVVWAGYQTGGGNGVIVKLANGLYAHYFHLSSIAVSIGQVVTQGQHLGNMGATGLYTTGPHLHFGMSTSLYGGYLNPSAYIGF